MTPPFPHARGWMVVLVLGLAAAAGPAARTPVTHTVTIDATSFQPARLTMRPGDRVVWVNRDLLAHTATSRAGGFDSQVIPAGKSWATTLSTTGRFDYRCVLHPAMTGVIEVR